jgi:hypothetical protein
MSYGDFDLQTAQQRFGLTLVEDVDLFAATPEAEPGEGLKQMLAEWAPVAVAMNTEKARSEMIIAPVLMEAVRLTGHRVSLFSGLTFDVDQERGLNGTCDYLISRCRERFFISRPVVTVVEAKREDITAGLGQCAAAMVAAQLLNARQPDGLSGAVYGAVTTGSIWRFLKLEGTGLTIDRREYYLDRVGKVLGILKAAVS